MIACVFIPEFALAAHRPLAQESAVPLLLVRYGKRSRTILAASAEARGFGVEVGHTLTRAQALCPTAQIVTADPERISRVQDQLLEVLWEFTNRVELDEALYPQTAVCYLDLGNLNEQDTVYLGNQIIQTLHERLHLTASVGLAAGKFTAYVAGASADPATSLHVPHGEEPAFVGPRSIELLPMPKEMTRRLNLFRIRTLGQFASLPRSAILSQFGKQGRLLYDLAHGLDSRPVRPRRMPRSESLRRAFDEALANRTHVDAVVHEMAGQLAQRLDERVSALHELTIALEMANGQIRREQLHLLQPVASPGAIARTLGQLIDRAPLDQSVAAIDVCLTHLVPNVPRQMELFTNKPARQQLIDLAQVLIERYGSETIYEAQWVERRSLLPERRFRLARLGAS